MNDLTDPSAQTAFVAPRLLRAAQALRAGELEAAGQLYLEIVKSVPEQPQALHGLALVTLRGGDLRVGTALLERSLQADPAQPAVLTDLARARLQTGQPEGAKAACEQALALVPGQTDALRLKGDACMHLSLREAALESYDELLRAQPDLADVWSNRGLALQGLDRLAEAVESYDRALALAPGPAAHVNRANVLGSLQRFEDALASYEAALRLAPQVADGNLVLGALLNARAQCCDWRDDEASLRLSITRGVNEGGLVSHPWHLLTSFDVPSLHRTGATTYAQQALGRLEDPVWRGERYVHDRIRVAYLSADFREHATAHLTAGLFEAHDRQRFQTIGVSLGPEGAGPMRRRLEAAFERFVDARPLAHDEVLRQLRALEVDIAVDLTGYTAGNRAGILAGRVAPVQVSYLGYPGTMGLKAIDYLIADRTVLPPEAQAHYVEQIVYLPDSYQVNDSRRPRPSQFPTRAEVGLPSGGFVFASFNAHSTITPAVFDVWMRLLARVPGSVLWLLADSPAAVRSLTREAAARGVDPARLIFAPRKPLEEHLARQPLADLMLDTLPYNAHTPGSEALWMGLPVLTCTGVAFAARVAASLLKAVGLPELITSSLEEYETRAFALATQPDRLRGLRERLTENRTRAPLFDTARTCRHLEAAYLTMWQRYQDGLPPEGFAVPRETP